MTGIGNVYGEALYLLAKEDGLTDRIVSELAVLEESFRQEPDFLRLLVAANLPWQERCAIVDRCFRDQVHEYVLNFLKLLTEKGYARSFGDCCAAYRSHYNQDNGILPVTAVTAVPLSGSQAEKLTDKLTRITGKTVSLANRVDPSVLGGMRLDYDGKRLDDTVAHRLDSLRSLLKNTVL